MTYDFTTLSPNDFELLVQDLLQVELGVVVEGFKTGRDGGIDLRYARYVSGSQSRTIVQCKHYVGTGLAGLRGHLAKSERPKLEKLSPPHYRLVTSVALSPKNKDDLLKILQPYTHSVLDIMGAEDLNALLRRHPAIERKHFKLWLASTTVLERILSNDIFSRTYLDTAAIKRRLSLFVPTSAVDRAQELLNTHGYCLLSGIPGIGKTTTAEILLTLAIQEGWEPIHLGSSAADAFRAFQSDTRQLFFYDDFLGRTSLLDNVLGKNEDRDLVRLLRACRDSKKAKRAILTTREYILQQARQSSEVLFNADLPQCVVSLEDYTRSVRAEILINHLYFFDVPEEHRRHLVVSGVARQVVHHPNYSPRIVEWMCDSKFRTKDSPEQFANLFLATLNDPSRLWRHAYENQISVAAREVLFGLSSLGDSCTPEALLLAVLGFRKTGPSAPVDLVPLRKAIAELEGNFLSIEADGKLTAIRFHNPSVKDFTDSLLATDHSAAYHAYSHAVHWEQVAYLLKTHAFLQSQVDDALFIRKVEETYAADAVGIEIEVRDGRRKMTRITPCFSDRFCQVLELAQERSPECQLRIAKQALSYLSKPNMTADSATDAARLYWKAMDLLQTASLSTPLSSENLAMLLRDDLRGPSDFGSIAELLDWENHSDLLRSIADEFLAVSESYLEQASSFSSTVLESSIDDVIGAAHQLGIEDELDLSEAQALLEQLVEGEERHAEMYEDEYREIHHRDRDDERAADDMLDSLIH